MRKVFYKIFIYVCLITYLPLMLMYVFNHFYADRYIIEQDKKNLVEIAESLDLDKLRRERKEEKTLNNINVKVYLRNIELNRDDKDTNFIKYVNRNSLKIDLKNMIPNEYRVKLVKLSSLTNHLFLVKKISENEIVVLIGEVIESKVVLKKMIGVYKRYTLFIIPMILIITYIVSRRISKPIEILEKVSYRISNLDFTETVKIKSKNELESLGNSINRMALKLKENIEELNSLNEKLKSELLEKERLLETEKMFMRTIGHELKTPVAIINGYMEALQDGMIEEKDVKKTYDIVYEEGMTINKIVKDINNYLKLEFKNLNIIYEDVELESLIRKSLKKYQLDIENKNIELSQSYRKRVLKTDKKLFNIVLNNLLTNAITYVDENRRIGIELTEEKLVIRNSSKEISQEEIEKIFDLFYKMDKSRNRKYGGTGLGLSIVKNILENLNLKYSFIYDKIKKEVEFIIKF